MRKSLIICFIILAISCLMLLRGRTIHIEGKGSTEGHFLTNSAYLESTSIPFTPEYDYGVASYYDYTLESGWSSRGHLVCASRDYPRGSYLKVYYQDKSVICKITDYGPDKSIHPDRIIDLSSSSFAVLSPLSNGVISVKVERIK
jgi:rare lipoprotein A (peptidoglycan hydrolase)